MSSATVPELPRTALAATLQRLRQRAWNTTAFIAVLCLGITVLLSAFGRGRFGTNAVYSYAIGLCCWAANEAVQLATAALYDATRRWRGLPGDATIFPSRWAHAVPAVLLCVMLGPPAGMWIADRLTGQTSPSLLLWDSVNTRITIAMSIVASLAAVAVLGTMERLAAARAEAEAARRLATESQLRLLQSQLEPHMLFNTLANLRVLIALDPPRAQAMLDRLIAYLRATLSASRAERHPLAAEFERVADYLALMAVRMGERLQVDLDLPDELRSIAVPPLLLQPLVENSIQHGLEPKVEGGRIEVRSRRDGASLVISVRDTGVGLGNAYASAGTGFGLSQVRARLATLYGERAGFTLAADASGGTLATLKLPIE
ncbi:MAG: histidine kinase [Burkholderiales bacterium]|nr:histidine kinase [Burkholderiales bacterium]MDE2456799.1 histidine kinase [Burkholderiales bacterium]